jgi:hypothetical protein
MELRGARPAAATWMPVRCVHARQVPSKSRGEAREGRFIRAITRPLSVVTSQYATFLWVRAELRPR